MTNRNKLFSFALTLSLGVAALGSGIGVSTNPAQNQAVNSKIATFAVTKMTCGSCPIIVNKAMSAVRGVQSVTIDADRKTATVRFDPKVTSIAAIATASANAGYPAKPTG